MNSCQINKIMVNTGLLVLTNPARVAKLLPVIKKHVLKTLYIQYFPEKNILISSTYSLPSTKLKGPRYSQIIANIYSLAVNYCVDVRVLLSNLKNPNGSIIHTKKPVELIIFDRSYNNNDANTFMQDCLSNTSMGCKFITIDEKDQEDCFSDNNISDDVEDNMYKNVVLGGTFDRLHNGHKIFISEAILRCTEKLTVGVTDVNMIKKKILWELIEPCSVRISCLKDFAEDVDSCLSFDVKPIFDMYGPTKEDPTFDMIVVSEETKKGGEMVNEKRKENNLKPLDIYVVKLVEDSNHQENEEAKISSSNNRIRLLGTRLKQPNFEGKPIRPYIIGLTGGIASGKSSIADKLEKLGAGLINCDLIAHALYYPGKKCYNLVVETFGPEYLSADGQINRKALGDLVFNDKNELQKLNTLLWPVIREETEKKINELYQQGFDIVIVEAAVLIQAGWQSMCHEIWTCIIPQEESMKRLIERNKLTEEQAKNRILVQPSNVEQVANAHVVVSTLWSHEFTQQQVQRAWNEIQKDLKKYPKN